VIGVFIKRENKQFTARDLPLAESFGPQAAIAIENARLFEEVQKLATTAPLTGINNRGNLFTLGLQEVERSERYEHPLSAIMLDIDHFKRVNDTYGHAIGDQILQGVSKRCASILRKMDILGRYGGEEFVILLPETDMANAVQVAERLRVVIENAPFQVDHAREIHITISLGVSSISPHTQRGEFPVDNLEMLLEQADQALYEAKADGRNLVRAYSKSPQ